MRKSMEAIAPIAVTGLLLAGCGEPAYDVNLAEPSSVTDLEFNPEHDEKRSGICLYGQNGVCYIRDEYVVHHPNEWTMTVEQCEGGPVRTTEEEQCGTETISISAEDFSRLSLRDHVIVDHGSVTRIPR